MYRSQNFRTLVCIWVWNYTLGEAFLAKKFWTEVNPCGAGPKTSFFGLLNGGICKKFSFGSGWAIFGRRELEFWVYSSCIYLVVKFLEFFILYIVHAWSNLQRGKSAFSPIFEVIFSPESCWYRLQVSGIKFVGRSKADNLQAKTFFWGRKSLQ